MDIRDSKRLKELFLYLVFGGITTFINIAVYYVCYYYLKISNVGGNIAAWTVAVLFAFVTNKIWVFESKSTDRHTVMRESVLFFGCRLGTGLMDLAIMYLCVDIMKMSGGVMKIIANVLVIILNYVFSKLLIFVKK